MKLSEISADVKSKVCLEFINWMDKNGYHISGYKKGMGNFWPTPCDHINIVNEFVDGANFDIVKMEPIIKDPLGD